MPPEDFAFAPDPCAPRVKPAPRMTGLTSAADLVAREFKEPNWAVRDIVAEGLAILAGKPKTGKSWLALDFAVAASGGYPAIGNIECRGGDVLLLALEDNDRRLHQRLKAGPARAARTDLAEDRDAMAASR